MKDNTQYTKKIIVPKFIQLKVKGVYVSIDKVNLNKFEPEKCPVEDEDEEDDEDN